MSHITKNYREGLTHYNKGNYQQALNRLHPLAKAGVAPAQRQIALMYLAGNGLTKSLSKAAFWAKLAKQGGDQKGSRLEADLRIKLSFQNLSKVSLKLTSWKARSINCPNGQIKNSIKPIKIGYELVKNKRISSADSRLIDKKFPQIVALASGKNGANRLYLSLVDRFYFYSGSRYDRYVGWKPNKKLNVIRISVSNFNDQKSDYFAKALMLTVKRRVFGKLSDSELIDPFMRFINGKRVFGSVYPDIRNGGFFKMMRQALTMAENLPNSLRRYVNIIDEIHYNPASKYFIRSGTVDAKGAFYIKSLSSEGHRMMFVRRKVLFSSPLFFLQTFIHEGTHAIQDQQAFRNYKEVKLLKVLIAKLQTSGKNPRELRKLREKVRVKRDYYNRWYRGIKTKTGRIQDINFECEATQNEIKAVKVIGGSPDVMKGSGYLKLCPKAQRQIIKWKENIRNMNRKSNR